MKDYLSDWRVRAAAAAAVLYAIFLLLRPFLGKADDWQYTGRTFWDYLPLVGLVILALLAWAIFHYRKSRWVVALTVLPFVGVLLVGGIVFWQLGIFNMAASSGNLGYSVGGAKDISNFRANIEHNYLPISTDITYEGLFYEYFFDTGEKKPCSTLFCPSYTYAVSQDPFSKNDDYYMSVGLNSGVKAEEFKRKKLNLVVVLDVSGSMGSSFDRYYYDQFGGVRPVDPDSQNDTGKRKIEIAREAVVGLLGHLNEDDRFGMVMFDNDAYLGKPMTRVGDTDMDAISGHILELEPRGGTYFEAGYREGTALFDDALGSDPEEYENRIIFLTDAMPNIGMIDENGLLGLAKKNSGKGIYSTFIGIGVDFNTELIDYITKMRGANYYSVHSARQFKTRMDDEFEYMVTPMVFNLTVKLDSKGYRIEKVYGSPEANEATGEIMRVNTLFPSKKEDGKTKGGLVLLKLRKVSDDPEMRLSVSYEDRSGRPASNDVPFRIGSAKPDYYDNSGIRKGVLLSRYADLMKNWIGDEQQASKSNVTAGAAARFREGIPLPPPDAPLLNRWERQSVPLHVSDDYKALFREFKHYFDAEAAEIGDSTLTRESQTLEKLINK
jgi:Ca-activated chloride channel homolog